MTGQAAGGQVQRLLEVMERPELGERYLLHERLGRGGMGAVYRATDTVLQRDVAIKVLGVSGNQSSAMERLQREARVLARLEHPGIVAVHDAGVLDDGRPWYAMRLVRGTPWAACAHTDGRGALLRRFLQVCDAVAAAHARGVVHRDLSPANVLIGEFGDVLVVDWGIAKVLGESGTPEAAGTTASSTLTSPSTQSVTQDGTVVGTPGFMAPEQAHGMPHLTDVRTDVFGLGALLRASLAADGARTPAALQSIVQRATADDPDARYPAVDALAADVRHWLDGERVLAHAESLWERSARGYQRHRALIWLLVAYAAVRVALLFWKRI